MRAAAPAAAGTSGDVLDLLGLSLGGPATTSAAKRLLLPHTSNEAPMCRSGFGQSGPARPGLAAGFRLGCTQTGPRRHFRRRTCSLHCRAYSPAQLFDLMGLGGTPSARLFSHVQAAPGSAVATEPSSGSSTTMTAVNQQGLNIQFALNKPLGSCMDRCVHLTAADGPSASLEVHLTATNSTATPFLNFVFQAAVPKVRFASGQSTSFSLRAQAFQIMLQPASSNIVPAFNSGNVSQNFTIVNTERVCCWACRRCPAHFIRQQPIRLRLRISFTANGQQIVIQEEACRARTCPCAHRMQVSNFPASAY